jgi:hypothetical protein
MIRTRSAAAALLAGAALVLAGCTSTPATSPTATKPKPSASRSGSPVALTCDNMIPGSTVKAFTAAGWTPEPGPLYVGDALVKKGLQCTWAGADAVAHSEVFGRGSIDAATAKDAETQLIGQGWKRIDSTEGVYITAGKDMILNPDDEGYGMTYLFGDGWVKVSSTKQGILLIADPA